MEPLSILAATGSLVHQAGKVSKLLYDFHQSRKESPLLVSFLSSQCSIVGTSLGYIHTDMQRNEESRRNIDNEQIFATFDMTLTSCSLTLSALERELESCTKAEKAYVGRLKLFLAEDHLQKLSDRLSAQVQAATLLVTIYQSRSIDKMKIQVSSTRPILGSITRTATRQYAESVRSFPHTKPLKVPDQPDYEKELQASPVYQRALRYATMDTENNDKDSTTIVKHSQTQSNIDSKDYEPSQFSYRLTSPYAEPELTNSFSETTKTDTDTSMEQHLRLIEIEQKHRNVQKNLLQQVKHKEEEIEFLKERMETWESEYEALTKAYTQFRKEHRELKVVASERDAAVAYVKDMEIRHETELNKLAKESQHELIQMKDYFQSKLSEKQLIESQQEKALNEAKNLHIAYQEEIKRLIKNMNELHEREMQLKDLHRKHTTVEADHQRTIKQLNKELKIAREAAKKAEITLLQALVAKYHKDITEVEDAIRVKAGEQRSGIKPTGSKDSGKSSDVSVTSPVRSGRVMSPVPKTKTPATS